MQLDTGEDLMSGTSLAHMSIQDIWLFYMQGFKGRWLLVNKKRNVFLSRQSFKYLSTKVSKQRWTLQFSSTVIHFSWQLFFEAEVWTELWRVKTSTLFLEVLTILCWRFDYVIRGWLTEKVKVYQCLVYKYYDFEAWIFCALGCFGSLTRWTKNGTHKEFRSSKL